MMQTPSQGAVAVTAVLEPTRAPVNLLVIDNVEPPTDD
jgi:hypothetical protein